MRRAKYIDPLLPMVTLIFDSESLTLTVTPFRISV
jgi:hypothetical protein